jgi:hypothetical protein
MSIRTLALIPLLAVTAPLHAQERVRVEAKVSSLLGNTVFIDAGQAAGLRAEDSVFFELSNGTRAEGRVRAVAKNSARVEMLPGAPLPSVGERAWSEVPRERLSAPREPQAWDPEKPLLAPAFGRGEAERESRTSGRAYLRWNGTFDNLNGSRSYHYGTLGIDTLTTNPFGKGGDLQLEAEWYTRSADSDGYTSNDSELNLRRLSYRTGGVDGEPTRWEFGRFQQHAFPELGRLDGAEWTQALADGASFGASAGAMPLPVAGLSSFEDWQAALYWRGASGEDQRLLYGLAYQNTWHDGEQDRNLFLGSLDWDPSRDFSLRGRLWIDLYDSADTFKDSAFEISELYASATWRSENKSGFTLRGSHQTYPQLLREEYSVSDPELLADGYRDRLGASWWKQLGAITRVTARADMWRDQDDDGLSFEAGASWRDLPWSNGDLSLSAFHVDGSYSSGPGARLAVSRNWGAAFANFAYSWTSYDQKGFVGEQATLAHHSLFGSLDWTIANEWDLGLYAEDRFGDELDSWTLGLNLQWRF